MFDAIKSSAWFMYPVGSTGSWCYCF